MQINELKVTVGEVCEGYFNDAEEGVVGYDERLDIRPKYNPTLNHISETNHQYGSFYYTGDSKSLYWYCYDQILMTRDLVDKFQGMEYCQSINGKSLLKKISPNKAISDHLPLVAKFERSVNDE